MNNDVQPFLVIPDPDLIDGSFFHPFRHYDCWPETHIKRFRKAVHYHHVPSSLASDNPILNLREIIDDISRENNRNEPWKYLKKISNKLSHHNLNDLSRDEERRLTENLLIFLNYLLIDRYGYAEKFNVDFVSDNQTEYKKKKSEVRGENLANLSSAYLNLKEIIDKVSNNRERGNIAHIDPDAEILTPIKNSMHFVDISGLEKNENGDLLVPFQVTGNDSKHNSDEIINEYEFYPIEPYYGWRWMGGNRDTDRYKDDKLNTTEEMSDK